MNCYANFTSVTPCLWEEACGLSTFSGVPHTPNFIFPISWPIFLRFKIPERFFEKIHVFNLKKYQTFHFSQPYNLQLSLWFLDDKYNNDVFVQWSGMVVGFQLVILVVKRNAFKSSWPSCLVIYSILVLDINRYKCYWYDTMRPLVWRPPVCRRFRCDGAIFIHLHKPACTSLCHFGCMTMTILTILS